MSAKHIENGGARDQGPSLQVYIECQDAASTSAPHVVVHGADPNSLHTVILWDHDAPYPGLGGTLGARSPFVHWMVANAPGADFDHPNAVTVVPYEHPAPPADSPAHMYALLVVEQRAPWDMRALYAISSFPRQRFPLEGVIDMVRTDVWGETSFEADAHTLAIPSPSCS